LIAERLGYRFGSLVSARERDPCGGRFYDMRNSAAAAKTTVEIGKKNILKQRLQIERQRALIAQLERDGPPNLVADAVRILGQMEQALAQMEAHRAAKQGLPGRALGG
jgi:hypothetical protein